MTKRTTTATGNPVAESLMLDNAALWEQALADAMMIEELVELSSDALHELEWFTVKLHALIQETNPIQRHHAGLRPEDVARVKAKVSGESVE